MVYPVRSRLDRLHIRVVDSFLNPGGPGGWQ